MLTVLTYEELEKLHRDKKLIKSDNFEFISDSTQVVIKELYQSEKENKLAEIIYVQSINGERILKADNSLLEDTNTGVMSYLPILDSEQVIVVVKDTDSALVFNNDTLEDLEATVITTPEEVEFYKEVIMGSVESSDACVYAVASELKLGDVIEIIYTTDLEEKVNALKENNKARDVLFKPTNLFV